MVSGAAETRERAELRNRGGAVERRQGRARNRASEKAGWAPEERASSRESISFWSRYTVTRKKENDALFMDFHEENLLAC